MATRLVHLRLRRGLDGRRGNDHSWRSESGRHGNESSSRSGPEAQWPMPSLSMRDLMSRVGGVGGGGRKRSEADPGSDIAAGLTSCLPGDGSTPRTHSLTLASLVRLDVSLNNISFVHVDTVAREALPSLTRVDLSGNPFECDCGLLPFISWLVEFGHNASLPAPDFAAFALSLDHYQCQNISYQNVST